MPYSPGQAEMPVPGSPDAIPVRAGPGRWVKPAVTLLLYALVFYWTDARAILARLSTARFEYVAAGVLLYAAGQALSAWKWRLLLGPVGLGAVRYTRLLAFYFVGMFFNLFLPTVVGGDAVKALVLAASWRAPAVDIMGVTLSTLTLILIAGFIAANAVLVTRGVYGLVDRL